MNTRVTEEKIWTNMEKYLLLLKLLEKHTLERDMQKGKKITETCRASPLLTSPRMSRTFTS